MGDRSGWCPDHICSRRAAFQYGIKMSEGRKTRRFKETNEKAELDRQWKKISAVGFKSYAYRKSMKKHFIPWTLNEIRLVFQIIEKRKKMEADGWVFVLPSPRRSDQYSLWFIHFNDSGVTSVKLSVFQGGRKEAQILKMAPNRCGVLICD